jgi:hypothetical protein
MHEVLRYRKKSPQRLIGQDVPLLKEVQPQHALKTKRRPASKPLPIKPFDRPDQSLPRTALSISPRKRQRRFVHFFHAYSTSEKLIRRFIAYANLSSSTSSTLLTLVPITNLALNTCFPSVYWI